MTGWVDDYGRALVRIKVSNPATSVDLEVDAWIDTAFTGRFMLTSDQITQLALPKAMPTTVALADGSRVILDTYSCSIEWFGVTQSIEALETFGHFAGIGIVLMEDCSLLIDYPNRTVQLSQ